MPDMLELMKRAALDAINASNPVNVVFGTVVSAFPLKIQIEQKETLTMKQLILSRDVTNYTVAMAVNHTTENHQHTHDITVDSGNASASMETHNHAYAGTKSFTVLNALQQGEKVILIRLQGGQKFLVHDRVGV